MAGFAVSLLRMRNDNRLSDDLLAWYDLHGRDLPWRRTRDPYRVWLSEVILQQTRVNQGLPYWERFVAAFPDIESLAAAGEQEVLRLWQGLGYYSRARNLHAAAREILERHDGCFPEDYAAIRALKGVGEYTAAAVASICFNLPHAVVDGNVVRFVSRLHGIDRPVGEPAVRRRIGELAHDGMDTRRPGDYNQAMMEFGATVCLPVNPGCDACPFTARCRAFRDGRVSEIPVRVPAAKVRDRYLHYLVLISVQKGREFLCLRKREGRDIWQGLYDFPCLEGENATNRDLSPGDFPGMSNAVGDRFGQVTDPVIHLLTHRRLHIQFYLLRTSIKPPLPCITVPLTELTGYPFPKPVANFLRQAGLLQH